MKYPTPKYVMIGDSITQDGSWNELLERDDIMNRGIAGDTSSGVLNRVDRLEDNIEKAFVMVGINDLIWNRSVDHVFNNYIQILDRLRVENITPIVQSTLYTGRESASRYNGHVKALNDKVKEYCEKENIKFIDLNDILSSYGQLDDQYTIDGVHLEARAYILWAESIKDSL